MRAMKTEQSNHNFGPPPNVTDGSIGDLPCQRLTEDGATIIRSIWVPSLEERAAVANGENVELDVFWIGAFPPVSVNVTGEQAIDAPETANGVGLIAWERLRQQTAEGWTPEHDDIEHQAGELASAAVAYALAPGSAQRMEPNGDPRVPDAWPWDPEWWKPKWTPAASRDGRIRELVKAGALIAAEIDRLQRAERSAS